MHLGDGAEDRKLQVLHKTTFMRMGAFFVLEGQVPGTYLIPKNLAK